MTWPDAVVVIAVVLALALMVFGFCLVAAVRINADTEQAKRDRTDARRAADRP